MQQLGGDGEHDGRQGRTHRPQFAHTPSVRRVEPHPLEVFDSHSKCGCKFGHSTLIRNLLPLRIPQFIYQRAVQIEDDGPILQANPNCSATSSGITTEVRPRPEASRSKSGKTDCRSLRRVRMMMRLVKVSFSSDDESSDCDGVALCRARSTSRRASLRWLACSSARVMSSIDTSIVTASY